MIIPSIIERVSKLFFLLEMGKIHIFIILECYDKSRLVRLTLTRHLKNTMLMVQDAEKQHEMRLDKLVGWRTTSQAG